MFGYIALAYQIQVQRQNSTFQHTVQSNGVKSDSKARTRLWAELLDECRALSPIKG